MKSLDEIRRRIASNRQSGLPDWRYRAARELVRQRVQASRHDDAPTKALRHFLEIRREHRARIVLRSPDPAFTDLRMAFRIRFGRLAGLIPLLESYLLSGLDDATIAKKFGLAEEVVSWFRTAFYDVEKLLTSRARILYEVIRISEAGRPNWDFSKVLKIVGYTLKAPALDQLLGIQDQPVGRIEPHAWLALQSETMTSLKQLLATAKLDPSDPKQMLALLNLMARNTEKDSETKDVTHAHVKALLDEIPWAVGDDGKRMLSGTKLGRFDEGAAELRDHQVLRVSAGEEIQGLEDDLLKELPPPRPRTPVSKSDTQATPLETLTNRNMR